MWCPMQFANACCCTIYTQMRPNRTQTEARTTNNSWQETCPYQCRFQSSRQCLRTCNGPCGECGTIMDAANSKRHMQTQMIPLAETVQLIPTTSWTTTSKHAVPLSCSQAETRLHCWFRRPRRFPLQLHIAATLLPWRVRSKGSVLTPTPSYRYRKMWLFIMTELTIFTGSLTTRIMFHVMLMVMCAPLLYHERLTGAKSELRVSYAVLNRS